MFRFSAGTSPAVGKPSFELANVRWSIDSDLAEVTLKDCGADGTCLGDPQLSLDFPKYERHPCNPAFELMPHGAKNTGPELSRR